MPDNDVQIRCARCNSLHQKSTNIIGGILHRCAVSAGQLKFHERQEDASGIRPGSRSRAASRSSLRQAAVHRNLNSSVKRQSASRRRNGRHHIGSRMPGNRAIIVPGSRSPFAPLNSGDRSALRPPSCSPSTPCEVRASRSPRNVCSSFPARHDTIQLHRLEGLTLPRRVNSSRTSSICGGRVAGGRLPWAGQCA